jgi:tripartite-type tricarboxylate transporter receptor subunit TctC
MSAARAFSRFHSAAAALALGAGVAAAQAQGYPAKPITLIVPFSAGGGVDATARLLTAKLGEQLKQPVVIENVAGAAGTIGTQRAARAPADGYTLLFAVASPLNVAPLVAPSAVRYDSFKDFVPVATVGTSPFVLIGKAALPARTTAELIQLAKAQPGKFNFGTDGVGTSLHVTAEMFKQRAGIDLMHVPYKSGPQVLTDVAGGAIDLAVLPVALVQGMVKENKVRAYGVTSKQRSEALPGVPSLSETRELAALDVESWMGLLAPAGLDATISARLAKEVAAVLADPDIVRQLANGGMKPMQMAPTDFAAYLARERKTLAATVAAANIKVD